MRQTQSWPAHLEALRGDAFVRAVARDLATPEHASLEPEARVLVACSGGPDSLALLYVLSALAPSWHWHLEVVHLDHHWRPESPKEGDAVAAHATSLGLRCHRLERDVAEEAKRRRQSLETAGRDVRRRCFRDLAAATGAGAVALGHQADDQAETVLDHLLRGGGRRGLGGMPWRDPEASGSPGLWARPLLGQRREAILGFCRRAGLRPASDPSNQDMRHRRNRLRLQLLPLLEAESPGLGNRLARSAEVWGAEARLLEAVAERALEAVELPGPGQPGVLMRLGRTALRDQPAALQRLVLRLVFQRCAGTSYAPSLEHIEAARRLLNERRGGRALSWPRGLSLRFGRDAVEVLAASAVRLAKVGAKAVKA
jgi:tRNA(Ile)-lysidine synthetase-like protein